MDIRASLDEGHSKSITLEIMDYIGTDKKRFSELMTCFFSDENRISQRASWVVGHCGEKHPELIYPYLEEMLDLLEQPVHNAIKRNTVRIMAEMDVPEELLGRAADICFKLLDDPKEAIAVRVFSMSVLYNIVKKEPELASELRLILEDHYPHGSAGFKSRGRKILKALTKLG
jgi:hypothetical protein